MSVSSTKSSTCRRARSTMVMKVGALRLAATVSPSWVDTLETTPLMGARMVA